MEIPWSVCARRNPLSVCAAESAPEISGRVDQAQNTHDPALDDIRHDDVSFESDGAQAGQDVEVRGSPVGEVSQFNSKMTDSRDIS